MQEFWVDVGEAATENIEDILRAAAENCVTTIVGLADPELAKSLGLRIASTKDGDIRIFEEAEWQQLTTLTNEEQPICGKINVISRTDEDKASKAVELGIEFLLISCPDWKIIPLENLIAKVRGKIKLIADVDSASEAKLALETLELGVDGVLLKTKNAQEVDETAKTLVNLMPKDDSDRISLTESKIIKVKQLSIGHRVCIDTCDIMTSGEGMLVGCQSSGLFLVQAEVNENPHVEPRPFRVNAGPISLYILTPRNKTRYLSELQAGDEVLAVDRDGRSRSVVVGRIKIERRPFLLIESEGEGVKLKTIVQNAETIRLVTPESSKPVTELQEGDKVLVHHQFGGRHFGLLVSEESIIER